MSRAILAAIPRRSALCAAVAASVLAPRGALAMELAELAARVKPAVVHLTVLDGAGEKVGTATGFFVSPDGLLVTSHHVLEHAAAITASLPEGGEAAILGVMARDAARDIAILQAEGAGYAILPLGRDSEAVEGLRIAVIGGPRGLSWTLSEGIVSAVRDGLPREMRAGAEHGSRLLQITAPISPGSSGSPVVTFEGRVVGVVQSVMPAAANVSFAVPVGAVRELLAALPSDAEPRPLRPVPWRNLVISVAVFAAIGLAFLAVRLLPQRRRARRVR